MNYKLGIIIVFIFINYSYNLEKEQIEYKINIIDNDMNSNYILPLSNEEDDYFYIITGEIKNNSQTQNIFKRYILKYDINSGALLDNYSFNSKYPFENPESIIAGYFSEYILTTTPNSIDIYNGSLLEEESFNTYNIRRELKKIGTEYYYAYIDNENKKNMIIIKMELVQNRKNNVPFYNIIKTSNPLTIINYQDMISCDFTYDKKYILYIYISEDKNFTISVHNKYLELVQIETKEKCSNFETSYFIKIIYFKENSNFITMNSEKDYISRLRYFRYIDGQFINQLYSILDNNGQYLDVEETQTNGYYYNMDIIAVDFDKIIKIFASGDQIIITIFQFYDHDSLLLIKIYNMKGYDYLGYHYFTQPRISIFKDSMLVCLSTFYNNAQKTGYFFINYPNSLDINLTPSDKSIKIKDLISMENNLFSLDLKFKILKVPKDFIFINLNSTEIKNDDILELNEELTLIQYRIKEGENKFQFEGIAIGDDTQYASSKLYPSYKNIPKASEIFIEGKIGNIIINFDDCLEGYYHLDYDYNICSMIKPKEYYIDENEKTYKSCQSPCSECSGPKIDDNNMNCITCKKGFNITEDTNSCYDYLPSQYYLDNGIFKRCYIRCNQCFNGSNDNNSMNCLSCISSEFFYRKDTFNCIFRNETNKIEIIEIQASSASYFVFVFILVFSILISLIFSKNCLNKEINYKFRNNITNDNIGNNIIQNDVNKTHNIINENYNKKEKKSLDINTQEDERLIPDKELEDKTD